MIELISNSGHYGPDVLRKYPYSAHGGAGPASGGLRGRQGSGRVSGVTRRFFLVRCCVCEGVRIVARVGDTGFVTLFTSAPQA